MASPRIFVSSTCYDLSETRAQIKSELEKLNYEVILSENNDVLFDPSNHTHKSCVEAVSDSDILILIISKRYGGSAIDDAVRFVEVDADSNILNFLNKVEPGKISITQLEVLRAIELDIPIFVFIHKEILGWHLVYTKNPDTSTVFPGLSPANAKYIFEFFDFLRLNRKINNAYFPYEFGGELIEIFKKQTAYFFRKLLTERKAFKTDQTKIKANIAKNKSKERSNAFKELFKEVNGKDEIRILGTGITSFLNLTEDVERYLEDGNTIKILLINDHIIKKDWMCSSKEFLERLNLSFDTENPIEIIDDLMGKTNCPLASLKFLIDTKHFNKYYRREDKPYREDINRAYEQINIFKKQITDNAWSGQLLVKHFKSFVPMSISAIFPDDRSQRKLLAEFIIPFTDKRILLNSSNIENPDIYNLFMTFFEDTWERATDFNETHNTTANAN